MAIANLKQVDIPLGPEYLSVTSFDANGEVAVDINTKNNLKAIIAFAHDGSPVETEKFDLAPTVNISSFLGTSQVTVITIGH